MSARWLLPVLIASMVVMAGVLLVGIGVLPSQVDLPSWLPRLLLVVGPGLIALATAAAGYLSCRAEPDSTVLDAAGAGAVASLLPGSIGISAILGLWLAGTDLADMSQAFGSRADLRILAVSLVGAMNGGTLGGGLLVGAGALTGAVGGLVAGARLSSETQRPPRPTAVPLVLLVPSLTAIVAAAWVQAGWAPRVFAAAPSPWMHAGLWLPVLGVFGCGGGLSGWLVRSALVWLRRGDVAGAVGSLALLAAGLVGVIGTCGLWLQLPRQTLVLSGILTMSLALGALAGLLTPRGERGPESARSLLDLLALAGLHVCVATSLTFGPAALFTPIAIIGRYISPAVGSQGWDPATAAISVVLVHLALVPMVTLFWALALMPPLLIRWGLRRIRAQRAEFAEEDATEPSAPA